MNEQEINRLIDELSASVRHKKDFDTLNRRFFSPGVNVLSATITLCIEEQKSGNYGRIEITPELDSDEFTALKALFMKVLLRRIDALAVHRNKILTALATDEVTA